MVGAKGFSLLVAMVVPCPGEEVATSCGVDSAMLQTASVPELPDAPMTPWMGTLDRARLYSLMSRATNYREFGSGSSTVLAATLFKNIKKIVSTESDERIVSSLLARSDIAPEAASGRLVLSHADIGPVNMWGDLKDSHKSAMWPAYSSYNSSRSEFDPPFWFDTVFVNGHFRVACLLKALKATTPNHISQTIVTVHHYVPRSIAWRLPASGKMQEIDTIMMQFADRVEFPPEQIPAQWVNMSREENYAVYDNDDMLTLFRKRDDCDEMELDKAIAKWEHEQQ